MANEKEKINIIAYLMDALMGKMPGQRRKLSPWLHWPMLVGYLNRQHLCLICFFPFYLDFLSIYELTRLHCVSSFRIVTIQVLLRFLNKILNKPKNKAGTTFIEHFILNRFLMACYIYFTGLNSMRQPSQLKFHVLVYSYLFISTLI